MGSRSSVTLLALLLVGSGASHARAERIELTTGPFVIYCTSTGQLCDPPYAFGAGDPAKTIRIRKITYTAPDTHCSPGRLLVSLDGVEVARLRYAAARQMVTKRKRLLLRPGTHLFEFRIEGHVGGCNVGSVGSWGGTVTLTGSSR